MVSMDHMVYILVFMYIVYWWRRMVENMVDKKQVLTNLLDYYISMNYTVNRYKGILNEATIQKLENDMRLALRDILGIVAMEIMMRAKENKSLVEIKEYLRELFS